MFGLSLIFFAGGRVCCFRTFKQMNDFEALDIVSICANYNGGILVLLSSSGSVYELTPSTQMKELTFFRGKNIIQICSSYSANFAISQTGTFSCFNLLIFEKEMFIHGTLHMMLFWEGQTILNQLALFMGCKMCTSMLWNL